ncbi:MAG: ABC transporter permease, partial [Clostridia bacterium]|nr:ABC transporter permease [Clostridia bacterium]
MKVLSKIYMVLIFALLYAPIIVLVLFSFNRAGTFNNYSEFSFYWYKELFRDSTALDALKNSLILALSSAAIATVIGTLAAYGINGMRNKYVKTVINSITNIPMMNPDIVTGVSMMLLFAAASAIPFLNVEMGFGTMLIAHTTFNLPYVILSVLPKFKQMDKHLSEAALDLGCTPAQTFLRVELPFIMPGVVSGFMLGFTNMATLLGIETADPATYQEITLPYLR